MGLLHGLVEPLIEMGLAAAAAVDDIAAAVADGVVAALQAVVDLWSHSVMRKREEQSLASLHCRAVGARMRQRPCQSRHRLMGVQEVRTMMLYSVYSATQLKTH